MCETKTMKQEVLFNPQLIERYDTTGPRYTSYPTAVQFHEGFDAIAYRRFTNASNAELIPRPLSLYVHLPFCQSLCYYCGCTKKITRNPKHGQAYLKQLFTEIELQGQLFDPDRRVLQLHLGGGTPTFFDNKQLEALMAELGRWFSLLKTGAREYAIEIDPRTVDAGRLRHLQSLGFNRISMGVQDFNPKVQKAVNRIQDEQETLELIAGAQEMGFESVSVDLIYGLPLQTPNTFRKTIETMISARPSRLAIYNYAHLPQIFRAQRMIHTNHIPNPATKLALLELTIGLLIEAGYVYIGMDHFALPDDELAIAQKEDRLQRNFQGYSMFSECDLVGLGMSSIGKIGDCYAQNYKEIPAWQSAVDAGDLPIWRGLVLNTEDRLRRMIIESIMCRGELKFAEYECCFELEFTEHFVPEMEVLKRQAEDGLLELDDDGFTVTPAGRLLLRNVAMVFDEYLARAADNRPFSHVI